MSDILRHFKKIHSHYPLRMGSVYILSLLIIVVSILIMQSRGKTARPNIVLIIADDLGWDDVSFHGSDQILTPNIDLLAYTGVALEKYYSHCVCTPSRSALLTGKYAYTTGMQGYPLTNGEDRALPLTEKILPQYLKELGYATHLVGKWHVGQSRTEYLPTYRGFDTHFGHRGGYIDYYEYTSGETWSTGKVSGLGLYRNLTAAWDVEGYITDIYNNEAKSIIHSHDKSMPLFLMVAHNAPHSADDGAKLQAPPHYVRAMRHVELSERRIYSAMVKKLDDSVGDIVEALLDKGILNNTIIAFISDNGGMTSGNSQNYASNWPLRGLKMSPFEGGMRVVGLLWAPILNNGNHLWKGYMHVTDWLPTLLKAAGSDPPSDIDGFNLWANITLNQVSHRHEIFEIDDYTGYAAIISGDYKLVTGTVDIEYSNHQGSDLKGIIGSPPSYIDTIKNSTMYSVLDKIGKTFKEEEIDLRNKIRIHCKEIVYKDICNPQKGKWCLYNIAEDPCETLDLSETHSDVANTLLTRLNTEMERIIPRTVPLFRDPRAAPSLHNYTWNIWADNIKLKVVDKNQRGINS